MASETVAIVKAGSYRAPDGQAVAVGDAMTRAVAGTKLHLPDEALTYAVDETGPARVEVTRESSLAAARRLGGDVACLVFASARNPGGGFLNGAQAQEESVARSSGLYHCLLAAREFYDHHRAEPSLLYSDRVIYSPEVPVFRDDKGTLLPGPYPVSFLTAAAPNRSAILRNQPGAVAEITGVLRRRAARVLEVAAAHGHRRLVLGAWGCGVFGNDPAVVAQAFASALRAVPRFEHVVFAVLERRTNSPTFAAFAELAVSGVAEGR
ncbi:TIGR02452 family protein [Kibdelosporangium persicum]|uniref:Microbial-type PARG catalytic domain-containing protein n=2 Tax=Kibdelosporangium persicum TaxID=2698649 RepID=A0ABX2FJD8_9PSEU|nr:hypothetical protein [Kibdelosporangium persicum]